MMKRIITVIFALVMMLSMATNDSYAAGPEASSLTVVMEYGGRPLKGIGVAVCRVADAKEGSGGAVYSATQEFAGAGADFSGLTDSKNIALAAVLDAYASQNGIDMAVEATDGNGKAYFDGLPAGLYLVAQRDVDSSRYTVAPYLSAVPRPNAAGDGWVSNVVSYPKTEPVEREGELMSVDVFKIWKGTDSPPSNIMVQLYQDGKPYGNIVSINAWNYWRHTWVSLDPGHAWTVDEIDAPAGYTKAVSGDTKTGFIITNTKIPGAQDGNQPGAQDGNRPGGQDGGQDGGQPGGAKGGTPKTWDASNTYFWAMLLVTSALCLLLLAFHLPDSGRLPSKPRRM